jgi:hypothetical protein
MPDERGYRSLHWPALSKEPSMSKKLATLAALAVVASAALATVTFDAATGKGFVGKGDVQLALGWNNAMLQSNASGVSFTYEASEDFDITCEWDTGVKNIVHHVNHRQRSTTLNAAVLVDLRKNRQQDVTGFNLTGFGSTVESGDPIPSVGDGCPGFQGNGAVVTAVQTLGATVGGLYVHYGLLAPVQIWAPAAP